MLPTDQDFAPAASGDAALYLFLFVLAYFLPTVIAWRRRHASTMAIAAVNILLGWIVIGWVWAFIWSLTGNVRPRRA